MINFHPHVVHFPIALTFALFFYELWCLLRKREANANTRNFLLGFVLLGAMAAVATGLFYETWMSHPHEGEVNEIMEDHESLGYIILGGILLLNVLNYFFRNKKWGVPAYRTLLTLIALLVGYQGYLGGELGHTHGLSLPPGEHPPSHLHHEHQH